MTGKRERKRECPCLTSDSVEERREREAGGGREEGKRVGEAKEKTFNCGALLRLQGLQSINPADTRYNVLFEEDARYI